MPPLLPGPCLLATGTWSTEWVMRIKLRTQLFRHFQLLAHYAQGHYSLDKAIDKAKVNQG